MESQEASEGIGNTEGAGAIERVDPVRQRWALAVIVLAWLLGIWAIVDLRNQVDAAHQISHHSVRQSAEAMVLAADGFFRMLSLWAVASGLYLLWLGGRILSAGRFPPPGALLLRDTRISHGTAAKVRGWLAVAFGVLFLIGAVVVPGVGGHQVRESLADALAAPDLGPPIIDPDVPTGLDTPGSARVLPSPTPD